jgi:hypothetical protein
MARKKKRPAARKGMGFKAAQSQIAAKQGISNARAGAILAASSRKASPAAKKRNPNLLKVSGARKKKKAS